MNLHSPSAFLLLALALLAPAAKAQDGQLYADPADPNASFVRVLAPGESVAVVNGTTFSGLTDGMTPFVMMQAGTATAQVGTIQSTAEIAPATFQTFLLGNDGQLHLLPDQIVNSPARADLVFYNLTDLPLVDLFVPSAKTMALTGVAPNASGQVTLKAPLTLDVEVQAAGAVLASLPAIEMRRRGGVSVVISGTKGTYSATATENTYAQ